MTASLVSNSSPLTKILPWAETVPLLIIPVPPMPPPALGPPLPPQENSNKTEQSAISILLKGVVFISFFLDRAGFFKIIYADAGLISSATFNQGGVVSIVLR